VIGVGAWEVERETVAPTFILLLGGESRSEGYEKLDCKVQLYGQ